MRTSEHRICGRIRAAGCRPSEEFAIVPEDSVARVPKDSIVPTLSAALARRRQWSARSLKLAVASTIERHRIDGRAAAKALGMEESQFCKSITWELDTLNASYLAEKLGLAVRGPIEQPVFVREVA